MTAGTFLNFAQTANLIDRKTLSANDVDLKFIVTASANNNNSNSGSGNGNNSNASEVYAPQRGIVRFQFFEAVVRLAITKYKDNGLAETGYQALNYLLQSEGVQELFKGIYDR